MLGDASPTAFAASPGSEVAKTKTRRLYTHYQVEWQLVT